MGLRHVEPVHFLPPRLVARKVVGYIALILSGRYDLLPGFEQALRFKLRPDAVPTAVPSAAQLAALAKCWSAVFLHVESRRTGLSWPSVTEYASWTGLREGREQSLAVAGSNLVRNAALGRVSAVHPREALYRELPALLAHEELRSHDWVRRGTRALGVWNLQHKLVVNL